MSPTIYDLVIVALLLLAAWRGLCLGLIGGLVRLAGLALGLRVAFRFANPLGRWLAEHIGLTATEGRIAALALPLMLTGAAVAVVALTLGDFLDRIALVGSLNRIGGALIGMALALLRLWVLAVLLLGVPAPLLPFATAVRHSETVHLVRALSPTWSHAPRAAVENVTHGDATTRYGVYSSPRAARAPRVSRAEGRRLLPHILGIAEPGGLRCAQW